MERTSRRSHRSCSPGGISPFRRGALLAAVVFASACGGAAPDERGDASSSLTARLLESVPPEGARSVNVTELGYDEGARDAPVHVVEFSDFGCGYCRKFHLETASTLREEYVETGMVRWKTIPFVTGLFSHSRQAARAAECAARQGRYAPMAHRLFEDQPTWKPSDDPGPHFRDYAREAGLDLDRFDACVVEGRGAERVEGANRAAAQLGVRATPTFFIDSYPVQGALPLEIFREVLDARLEGREPEEP